MTSHNRWHARLEDRLPVDAPTIQFIEGYFLAIDDALMDLSDCTTLNELEIKLSNLRSEVDKTRINFARKLDK